MNNRELFIAGKKLTIISLGNVVFDGKSGSSFFMDIGKSADITICDVVFTGYDMEYGYGAIRNDGNLTFNGCTFTNIKIFSSNTTRHRFYFNVFHKIHTVWNN